MKLTIALCQMQIIDGEKEKNLSNALDILKSLSISKNIPDIVCFPELFTSGYDLRNAKQYAEAFPGSTIKKLAGISKNKFVVIGSVLEVEKDKFYNTAIVLGKKGDLIGKYRKVHLFSPMLEKEFLNSGNEITTFDLPEFNNLRIGLAICYDIRFPELFRMMALEGAQIIFIPSEFPSPKREVWKTLLRARAIENQLFIIGVNRVGKGKSDEFFGCSLATNGDFFEGLEDKPEIKAITIDLDTLTAIRKAIPALNDRRTDLYKL